MTGLRDAKPEAFHGFYDVWFPRLWSLVRHRLADEARCQRVVRTALTCFLGRLEEPGSAEERLLDEVRAALAAEVRR